MKEHERKVCIVRLRRFNRIFTSSSWRSLDYLPTRSGAKHRDRMGSWIHEIPFRQAMADIGKYDAIIALGVVIQGSTAHANYVNAEVSKGLAQMSLQYKIPVIYGVVTTENIEQAIERSGSKAGNRGSSAAETAIEMANLMKALRS